MNQGQIKVFDGNALAYCKMHQLNCMQIEEPQGQVIYFAYPNFNDKNHSAFILIEQISEQDNVRTSVFLCKEKIMLKFNEKTRMNDIVNYDVIIKNNLQDAKRCVLKCSLF